MYTIIETPLYTRLVDDILTPNEQEELTVFLSRNPLAGEVIPQTNGCRKIR